MELPTSRQYSSLAAQDEMVARVATSHCKGASVPDSTVSKRRGFYWNGTKSWRPPTLYGLRLLRQKAAVLNQSWKIQKGGGEFATGYKQSYCFCTQKMTSHGSDRKQGSAPRFKCYFLDRYLIIQSGSKDKHFKHQ